MAWKAYLPIENTLNGKRPRLVHRPRAGPNQSTMARIGLGLVAWIALTKLQKAIFGTSARALAAFVWLGMLRLGCKPECCEHEA